MSFFQDLLDKAKAEAQKKYDEFVNPKSSTPEQVTDPKSNETTNKEEQEVKAPVPFYKNKWVVGITIVAVLSVAGVIIYKKTRK